MSAPGTPNRIRMSTPLPYREPRRADLGAGAWIVYEADWIPRERADALFAELLAGETWEQRSIRAFGKEIPQPRLMAWAGDVVYAYSGLTLEVRPESEVLRRLRSEA